MKKLLWFGLLGLMFAQSALAETSKFNETVKNITKDMYFGYGYSHINYNLNSSGVGGKPDTTASAQTIVIGRHLNDRTSFELNMLYKSSKDSFNDNGDIATLGHSFDMEVNKYYALNFRGVAYRHDKYDAHGIIGWTRLRYLDQDNDIAQGSGLNFGLGVGAQLGKRFYLKLDWEKLPRVDYDESVWNPPLDPMHVEASLLKLQIEANVQ